MDAEKMMMQKRIDTLDQHAIRLQGDLIGCERENAWLKSELEAVKRERDAAVHDLSKARDCCHFCKHDAVYTSVCDECNAGSSFEWRGVQETEA